MCTSLWPSGRKTSSLRTLAANTELFDQVKVCLTISGCDVLQKALALTNELQQTAACRKVFLVHLQVLSQLFDALSRNPNLDSSATGVSLVACKARNNCLFFLTCNHTLASLTDEDQKFKDLLLKSYF